MEICSNYSFQLVKDARTAASIGIAIAVALTLLTTLVALTYLGYLPHITYPIGAAGFTAILLIGVVIATLRRKNEPSSETPILLSQEKPTPIEQNNGQLVPHKELIKEDDNIASEILNDRMGIMCPTETSGAIAEKIILDGHEVYFLGIFRGSCNQQQEIKSLTDQIQASIQQALSTCDISNETQVDEILKKILNAQDLKVSAGMCASVALITDNKIYNLSIGAGIPHIVLVAQHNPYPPNNGCYEISCRTVGAKNFKYYLTSFGTLDSRFDDDEIEKITEETDKPRIRHLTKGVTNGGGTFFVQPHGYQTGDYLILGCNTFWASHGLNGCYKEIKEMEDKGVNPQAMANSLAIDQQTVIVFKL